MKVPQASTATNYNIRGKSKKFYKQLRNRAIRKMSEIPLINRYRGYAD